MMTWNPAEWPLERVGYVVVVADCKRHWQGYMDVFSAFGIAGEMRRRQEQQARALEDAMSHEIDKSGLLVALREVKFPELTYVAAGLTVRDVINELERLDHTVGSLLGEIDAWIAIRNAYTPDIPEHPARTRAPKVTL